MVLWITRVRMRKSQNLFKNSPRILRSSFERTIGQSTVRRTAFMVTQSMIISGIQNAMYSATQAMQARILQKSAEDKVQDQRIDEQIRL
jgi:hypothetical protein